MDDRREIRVVQSKHMKMRILCRKVMVKILQHAKVLINLELARVTITITYQEDLTSCRNQVNPKHPPEVSSSNNRKRIVREIGFTMY